MKKKVVYSVLALVVLAALIVLSFVNPGTIEDPSTYAPAVFATPWALLPPVIAIVLALITKEVYSSLFIGVLAGGALYANGNLELMMNTVLFDADGGLVTKLADSWNVGILIFLVVLGIMVALMNKVGGSAAFGRWAAEHIKSRIGAQLATMVLGVLIFIDDYFNCLTVGSVMRPVTDRHKISRAKLAYLIDSTAAPVCIIAPISSWAAAVTTSVPDDSNINGFAMFLKTIPYNYYALLTLLAMVMMIVFKMDFGPMKLHEDNAKKGDLFTVAERPYGDGADDVSVPTGKVIDLVFPIIVLIVTTVFGMVYTGGFFDGVDFITAFADCNASKGLVIGSIISLIVVFAFYMLRGGMTFSEFTSCIPEGFKAMVAPILILAMAWTLSGMTGLLGAKYFVAGIVEASSAFLSLLPAIIFVVSLFLAFATGTSWGTFAIIVPIICHAFPSGEMLTISIAACLAGAVCGDHCSPISDTTIMASAGAQCDHVVHVSTQMSYALTVAAVSFVSFLLAGFIQNVLVNLIIAVVLMVVTILVLNAVSKKKAA